MITWRVKANGTYILCKDGVYWALTAKELFELKQVVKDIKNGTHLYHKEDTR